MIPLTLGIDVVTQHLGELSAEKSYLLEGERGTGKTTFILQFLYQGLQERQVGILVSSQAPESVVTHARIMGMDLAPFLRDGTLQMYEIARKDAYPAAEFFSELKQATASYPSSRFALEGLLPSQTDGLSFFLRTLETMKTTAFITLELPAPQPMVSIKEALESGVAGSLLLKAMPEDSVKTCSVKKWAGHISPSEFKFRVEAGRGLVDVAKARGIQFPRYDDH